MVCKRYCLIVINEHFLLSISHVCSGNLTGEKYDKSTVVTVYWYLLTCADVNLMLGYWQVRHGIPVFPNGACCEERPCRGVQQYWSFGDEEEPV